MVYRIEIAAKFFDTRADVRKRWLESIGIAKKIKTINLVDVYTIDKDVTKNQLKLISSMLSNPVAQRSQLYSHLYQHSHLFKEPQKFTWAIEIGFLPGVTDNVAHTAKEAIEDLLKIRFEKTEGVYTTQLTFVQGDITKEDAYVIGESIANPLIQRIHIKSFQEYKRDKGMDLIVPKVKLSQAPTVSFVDLQVDDTELLTIGKSGILGPDGKRRGPLALNLSYMKAIQSYFQKLQRSPTDIELESIAQTWSEHCKHTIFADPIDNIEKGLFKTYIQKATEKIRALKGKKDFCVSVFTDNSGAIEFDDTFLVTHKVETHNSPSALDPFGGAITGIVGVNRDALGFGLGAKPIINTYGFCLDDPKDDEPIYRAPNYRQKMLSPRRIMMGVIDGVNAGGNCSGIPTPQGFLFFDKRYKGKPLVFVGTVGLIPKKIGNKPSYEKQAKPGDYIVMVGGRVGLDGIHGATFASEELTLGSPSTAVQIGDPITQKKLSDAITKEARHHGIQEGIVDTQRILSEVLVNEARDFGLYSSITDNGAGGLSCSVAEMAKESGGCEVWLEKVPLKYPGLEPWQIWISESQERMTLSVPPHKWEKFSELMKRRGVEATIIGKFTDSKKCLVLYQRKTIMDIGMDFLHNGLPKRPMKTVRTKITTKDPKISSKKNLTPILFSMLKRLNLTSFEFISSQYDHEVQGGMVIKPLVGRGRVNTEVTVIKPVLSSEKALALSQGIYPTYSDIDTYQMAGAAIDTAIRNVVSAGTNPEKIALLDNFCWCSPTDPIRLAQLKDAAKACYDFAVAFQTPFISGKDSMYNDFVGFDKKNVPVKISIPPTLLISSIGIVEDVEQVVSPDAKFVGDLVYILGDSFEELGASEYFSYIGEQKNGIPLIGKSVPSVNAVKNKKTYETFYKCVRNQLVASSQSIHRGGLAVALAKTTMGGLLGMEISLKNIPGKWMRDDFVLFSESQGRLLVTVSPQKQKQFEKVVKDIPFAKIGTITEKDFIIESKEGKPIIKTSTITLLESYKSTFKNY